MNPKHHKLAARLSTISYIKYETEIYGELFKLGLNLSACAIVDGSRPLNERVLIVPQGRRIFVVFRGTQSRVQWVSNMMARKISIKDLGKGVKVHGGFYAGHKSVMPKIMNHLKAFRGKKVIIVGHSRGAAEATIAMQALDMAGFDIIETHLFGSPRVLNPQGARLSDKTFKGRMWRWVVNNDTVCRVPFRWMGFKHVGLECYFDSSDRLHRNPSLWIKIKGQIRGRQKGGLFDGISDHNTAKEYERVMTDLPF